MRITKKVLESAPRVILGVDYQAGYRPMTIDLFALEAGDVYDAMVESCKYWDDSTVYCLSLYERTGETEGGYIRYIERLITYGGIDWRIGAWGNAVNEVWYGVEEQKPMFRSERSL